MRCRGRRVAVGVGAYGDHISAGDGDAKDATTPYTRSGGLSIAYQDVGTGPALLWVPGFVSHVERKWELPAWGGFMERLARFSSRPDDD